MIRRRRQNKDDNNQNIWKEILEELRSMNQNLTQKLDTMNENITKQLIQVNKKLGQIIKITNDDESKGMKMYFASDKTGKTGQK